MVATGQEMVRGKKILQGQGILFWVSENWHFEEKSGKIEIVRLIWVQRTAVIGGWRPLPYLKFCINLVREIY